MRRALLSFTLPLFAACSSTPPASRPVPAAGTIALRNGWHSTVEVDRTDSITLTMPSGDHQVQRYRRQAGFTLTVDRDGAVLIRLDSLRTGGVPDSQNLVGATWSGQLGDPGVSDLQLSGKGSANALTPLVRSLLPRLPNAGALPRTAWNDSATGRSWSDIFTVSERRTAKWSAGAESGRDSSAIVPVHLTEEFEQLGDGNQDGRKMTLTAQGSRSGTYYVTPSGLVRHAELRDSAAVSVGVPETRQVMSGVRFTRTDIRFISPGGDPSGIIVGSTPRP